jgi:hypothetical protein
MFVCGFSLLILLLEYDFTWYIVFILIIEQFFSEILAIEVERSGLNFK